jgi:uncharacterized membrane protein
VVPVHLDRRDTIGLAIVAITIVVSALAYPSLPDQLAIHFGAGGQPDNFLATPLALALIPAIALGIVVLFKILPWLDPLGENTAAFQQYYDLVAVLTVGILAYVQGLILAWNLGYDFAIGQALVPVLAITYYVVGVVIENAEQNWFVGIRTPWTLSNERVWRETHDQTAILFKLAGVLALLAIPFPDQFALIAIGPIAVAAVLATIYSFVIYRRVAPE